ncbi:MAG: nicotinate-nucleotide adenylyltransferase [Candidatus Omnitrophica bacterium]|nr:nicotinate-nucleotide adenylyltransferase [Candidatus Omnitrophota bacterium]
MAMDSSGDRIGIFGGCFDPVHTGHLIIAEMAREQFCLERVIFVPARIPPHRAGPVASSEHRLEMLKLAIKGNQAFEISDAEISRDGVSYTYDTMMIFKEKFSSTNLYIIVGWDAFVILPSWRNAEKLAQDFLFIVAPRITERSELANFGFDLKYKMLDCPRIEISSTLIRQRIKAGKSIRYLVPDSVFNYIMKENVYG